MTARLPVAAIASLALLASGCTTARARGVVTDPEGRPVPNAKVVLSPTGGSAKRETALTDANGCFSLLSSAKTEPNTFVLTVRADGYKELSFAFPGKEDLIAAVRLLANGAPGESSLERIPPADRDRVYTLPCVPPAVPGATSIGIR